MSIVSIIGGVIGGPVGGIIGGVIGDAFGGGTVSGGPFGPSAPSGSRGSLLGDLFGPPIGQGTPGDDTVHISKAGGLLGAAGFYDVEVNGKHHLMTKQELESTDFNQKQCWRRKLNACVLDSNKLRL